MKLEQQVCSLELPQRLEKLGVKQESYFLWLYTEPMSTDVKFGFEPREWSLELSSKKHAGWDGRTVSVFTVAELGEMLPLNVRLPSSNENGCWLECHKENGSWSVYYDGLNKKESHGTVKHREVADTEADARAKMLIYLFENNLITHEA